MKRTFKNSLNELWENEKGDMVGIFCDDCIKTRKSYFHVVVREAGWERGKTVATRCTYETAMQIVNQYN